MAKLKKGQVVTIFEDPISRLKPEGKATLVKFESKDNDGIYNMERWQVRFQGDSETFSRKIMPQDQKHKIRAII